jgi:hypothetical protein
MRIVLLAGLVAGVSAFVARPSVPSSMRRSVRVSIEPTMTHMHAKICIGIVFHPSGADKNNTKRCIPESKVL